MRKPVTATYVQEAFVWPAEEAEMPSGRSSRCQWETLYGTQCSRLGSDGLCGICLCSQHERSAEHYVHRWLEDRPHLIRDLYWDVYAGPRLGALPGPGRSVVYFIERQGFVKIGTTTSLEKRLRDIGKGSCMLTGMTVGPVRLVATMPGDQRHEKFLHDQFHELRVEGEWFLPDGRLCEFIHRLPNVDLDVLEAIEIRHGLATPDEEDEDAQAS
jgi:hypothetical protein